MADPNHQAAPPYPPNDLAAAAAAAAANNNGVPEAPPVAPLLQIQDIDAWLLFNGLRAADDPVPPGEAAAYNSFMSSLNQSEAQSQHEQAEQYQKQVHETIFSKELQAERDAWEKKQKLLNEYETNKEVMELVTEGNHVLTVPLQPLAAECDVIYTLASSRRYMPRIVGTNINTNTENSNKENTDKNEEPQVLDMASLSLEQFSKEAVEEFISLLLTKKSFQDIQDNHVVDVCYIAHYLQCSRIVHGTKEILLQHVDSENCLSLCQMADSLELPDLFERALFHMLKSLENLEEQEAYEDFSPELKARIADIRAVFGNHAGKPQKDSNNRKYNATTKKRLYFTSLEEYIAIFAETVQYHRERLEEAREENVGRNFSDYAQLKIEKQELRVLTLEAMLQEQKRLFGKKASKKPSLRKESTSTCG